MENKVSCRTTRYWYLALSPLRQRLGVWRGGKEKTLWGGKYEGKLGNLSIF